MTTKVLVTDYAWKSLSQERAILGPLGVELITPETGEVDELARLATDVEAILTCWAKVDQRVLDAASHCRTVARYGVGLDNIDVAHATRLGMVVTNVPFFCQEEVADHTMLLLLALARRLKPLLERSDRGDWGLPPGSVPTRIRGKVLGLVGLGSIAQAVVPRAQAHGMAVMAYRRSPIKRVPDRVQVVDSLDAVLEASDVVSLHVPLTPETARMIDGLALERMKSTAFLLNTARGGLVDTDALLQALDNGMIAGAGLDVTDPEPLPRDHPLRNRSNVVMTSHTAFNSDGSVADLTRQAAQHVADVLTGRRPENIVNPEVLDSDRARFQFD